MIDSKIAHKMSQIKLFVSDIDGVLTDAGMYYTENGDELKKFNTRDGAGFWLLHNAGIQTALITSELVNLVRRRATKLKIDHLFQVKGDKWNVLKKLIADLNLTPENVSYIGDDINDITCIENVGLSFAVADAVDEVKNRVDFILSKKGGEGAVREAVELILKTTNQYQPVLELYFEQKRNEQ